MKTKNEIGTERAFREHDETLLAGDWPEDDKHARRIAYGPAYSKRTREEQNAIYDSEMKRYGH